jgi:integrase
MLGKQTKRVYETSYRQFVKITKLSEMEIQSMDVLELSKTIDKAFSVQNLSPSSILTRISGVKGYIFERWERELPSKTKIRKALSKKKPKQSGKIDLTETEVMAIEKFFTTQYKQSGKTQKLRTLRNLILFKLLAYTGQRIGDILGMRVNQARQDKLFYKQEKTGKEVLIPNPAKTEIEIYCHLQGLEENNFLFSTGLNKSLSYQYALNIISRSGLKAIGKEITPHVFRKYVVTHLKKLGIDDTSIMAVTGHSDLRMIGYYTGNGKSPENLQELLLRGV